MSLSFAKVLVLEEPLEGTPNQTIERLFLASKTAMVASLAPSRSSQWSPFAVTRLSVWNSVYFSTIKKPTQGVLFCNPGAAIKTLQYSDIFGVYVSSKL